LVSEVSEKANFEVLDSGAQSLRARSSVTRVLLWGPLSSHICCFRRDYVAVEKMGVKGIYPLLISHLSTVSVTALMTQGITKMIIDGSVMMHWAIHKAPWDARPGSDLTTFVQVCLEALRVFENL